MAGTCGRLFPRASVPVNLVNTVNPETYTPPFFRKNETPFPAVIKFHKQAEKSPSPHSFTLSS